MKTSIIASIAAFTGYTAAQTVCSPTGEGYCNFGIITQLPVSPSGFIRGVRVYDRYCNEIGSMSSVSDNFDLSSQLPYMILVRDFRGGFNPTGTFYYADGAYNIAGAYCYDCGAGLEAKECCRLAFRC